MRSFVKTILALLFLFLSFGEVFAFTYLEKVRLESSSSNIQYHSEVTGIGPPCFPHEITKRVIDGFSNGTITRYGSQYLSRNCQRETESNVSITVKQDCSVSPPYSTFHDSGENCKEITLNDWTLALVDGSIRVTWSTAEWSRFDTISGESSFTLTIDCQDEKKARLLEIMAKGFIISEAQPTGMEFSINGFSPSSVYPEDIQYYELYYVWSGILIWKIPIDRKCGETIIITPSVANGYGQVGINYIKAIFVDCTVDVFPPDVKPQKTGNNVADVTVAMSNPAPYGGVEVEFKVEATENSGGHSHDGNRLKGEITDDSGNKVDTIFFAEGEIQKMVKYKASEVAGEEKIIAQVVNDDEAKCEKTVRVQVPGLMRLDDGENYDLKESTSIHPSSYWGAMDVLAYFNSIANAYAVTFPNDERLVVTDISLPGGGVFDLCGTYKPQDKCSTASNGGHSSHRTGRDVDVRNSNIPKGNRKEFEIICKYYGAVPNDHGNHYHLDF